MRKIGLVAIIFAVIFGVSEVSAMSEAELRAKLVADYEIGGETQKLDTVTVNKIDEYLSKNELSAKDCDYIAAEVDKVIEILKEEKTIETSKLSSDAKKKIKASIVSINNNTSVTCKINGGNLEITNADNSIINVSLDDRAPFRQTGLISVVVIAGLVVVMGCFVAFRKMKKVNA